jgi:hypothetical protein
MSSSRRRRSMQRKYGYQPKSRTARVMTAVGVAALGVVVAVLVGLALVPVVVPS